MTFAGEEYPYVNEFEKNLFIEEIEKEAEERISIASRRVSYPIMAGSSSLSDYYEKKYDLITTPMTWAEANNTAFGRNGRIVVINSRRENDFVLKQYKDARINGFDLSGNPVNFGWIVPLTMKIKTAPIMMILKPMLLHLLKLMQLKEIGHGWTERILMKQLKILI